MKEYSPQRGYPVGSLCEIQNAENFLELNGAEFTITGPLMERDTTLNGVVVCYETDLEFKGIFIFPQHHQVKLKQFPPKEDAWLREKMQDLLTPLPADVLREEEVV